MKDEFEPDYASAPGETVRDILTEQRMSANTFTKRMGVSRNWIKQLFLGYVVIDMSVAKKLVEVLGAGNVEFWLKRDELYRKTCLRLNGGVAVTKESSQHK